MRFGDILRLCRQNLWRRKSRTILTVLGVIVGCCSIVLMVSLGQGINEQNEKMLKSMGDLSIVTVYTNGYAGPMGGGGSSEMGDTKLDDKAVESFRAMSGVSGVTPMMNFPYNVTARAGAGGASGSAAGQSENVTLDVRASGIVAGDYNKGYATSDGLVMDLQALKELAAKVDPAAAKKATAYDQVLVKAADLKSVPEVESQIKALGYETSSYEDMRKSLEEQSRAIQLILGGIGAVSLLVAAIGIANTMVMSVTERTREIGIMKALGCYVRDIRVMFLAEAGAIGFFGGLIGCVLSGLISLGINVVGALYAGGMSGGMSDGMVSGAGGGSGDHTGDGTSIWTILWQAIVGGENVTRYSVIPWWLFLFAVLFSTLIGLLFGFGPANKAVKIPALDAIKNNE